MDSYDAHWSTIFIWLDNLTVVWASLPPLSRGVVLSPPQIPPATSASNIARLLMGPSLFLTDHITRCINDAGHPDIRPAHSNVLSFLGHGPRRLTELAALANLTKATLNYLVDDLEELGYVERLPDPLDRRAKLVGFTPRGKAVGEIVRQVLKEVEDDWRTKVGSERFEVFKAVLLDLNESI